ncbi:MAG TPA: aconitase X catalytic domain-containing protein [Actinomycetota bacterium]|nr:aconitase X catalytic domain-containing protein [Actinomycetota bacterium]
MPVELAESDRAFLRGERGEAAALAMRIVVEMAGISGAERLIDVASAHVDGCLYHGRAGLEFAERLVAGGARVAVPTTLNVGALDLLHPDRYRGDAATAADARRQMDAYVAMGCKATWTCAPYQLPERPAFGQHVAWAESNAIVFCNSVLGARTDRYGDFLDICAAVTGRVPLAGLHRDEARRARLVVGLDGVSDRLLASDALYPVLGHLLGRAAGSEVAAIVGIPADVSEDRIKALGAAAASSGSVAMVHVVGVTPEAPTVEAATGGARVPEIVVTTERLRAARDELGRPAEGRLGAVSVGTPHASLAELERLLGLLGSAVPTVPLYVNVGRAQVAEAEERGLVAALRAAGVRIVSDTCTYIAPVMDEVEGPVMTDSGKWAWYAPANLGVEVVIGGLEECVRSAVEGRVVLDETLWADG